MRVGVRERRRDRDGDLDRPADRECALGVDELPEVAPVDVLEDDEPSAVVLAAVEHRDDVRMAQTGDGSGLAVEALEQLGVRSRPLVQQLHGHDPPEAGVERAEDDRRSARSDPLLEPVAIRDQCLGSLDHTDGTSRAPVSPNLRTRRSSECITNLQLSGLISGKRGLRWPMTTPRGRAKDTAGLSEFSGTLSTQFAVSSR